MDGGVIGNADENSGNDQKDMVIVGDSDEINLSPAQLKVVAKLKEFVEEGQLLGFLQGFNGAGKTTTAEKMEDVTGLRVLYCGSTGTAATNFKSETINSFLSLRLSIDYFDFASETT